MDWMEILKSAVIALGVINWSKIFVPKDTPSWAYAVALPLVCLGAGLVVRVAPEWVEVGVLGLAVAQLGYDTVFQPVKKLLGIER